MNETPANHVKDPGLDESIKHLTREKIKAVVDHVLTRECAARLKVYIDSCVHCGFCNATCPTYQLLGDELDGPRGRIYLIKQALEGKDPGPETQLHLDRCLTCRNCESTCPSGVNYSQLLNIGRSVINKKVPRSLYQQFLHLSLRKLFLSRLLLP